MSRLRLVIALVLVGLTGLPAAAQASKTQEGIFQDDDNLVYAKTPAAAAAAMDRMKSLGADRLRISVFWNIVAPDPMSTTRPDFDATDPAAYPAGAWDRYDTIVRLAAQKGLAIDFNVTSPAPFWATGQPKRTELEKNYTPNAVEFEKFVQAVATRYSGTYVPGQTAAAGTTGETGPTGPTDPIVLTPPAAGARASDTAGMPLPRVSFWTVWNEPNQPGWLTPQWAIDPRDTSRTIETSPALYRLLVDGAYTALTQTGHGSDTILIGETAPKGNPQPKTNDPRYDTRQVTPGLFIRRLYCLDDNLQFLQGTSAQIRGCPVSNQAKEFVAAHPGLFRNGGWAHHPYELVFSPTTKPMEKDFFTTANIGDLSLLLKRVWQRYGQPIPGGGSDVPLWFTEYGYQTNPPDPLGVSPAQQAAYINQAEWLTFNQPQVKSLAQFLLVDSAAMQGADKTNNPYGGSFQSGLEYGGGKAKPALAAYELPLFLPATKVRKGRSLKVFGMARSAPNGTAVKVRIQRRGASAKSAFRTVKTVTASKAHGYFTASVKVSGSGAIRLSSGGVLSRTQSYRVTSR